MGYSMNLNNFKKVTAVFTVFTTVVCLVPESAQAARFSGSPNFDVFSFTLETSVNSANILEPVYTHFKDQQNGSEPVVFNFDPGTLTEISSIDDMDLTNLPLPEEFKGGKKSTSTLSGRETISLEPVSLTLSFFFSSDISDSISTFSELSDILERQESGTNFEFIGGVQFVEGDLTKIGLDEGSIELLTSFRPFATSFAVIPEPSATGTLLGIGALGAALLLKKRSKYSQ